MTWRWTDDGEDSNINKLTSEIRCIIVQSGVTLGDTLAGLSQACRDVPDVLNLNS